MKLYRNMAQIAWQRTLLDVDINFKAVTHRTAWKIIYSIPYGKKLKKSLAIERLNNNYSVS